jgi:hypothetical protein
MPMLQFAVARHWMIAHEAVMKYCVQLIGLVVFEQQVSNFDYSVPLSVKMELNLSTIAAVPETTLSKIAVVEQLTVSVVPGIAGQDD